MCLDFKRFQLPFASLPLTNCSHKIQEQNQDRPRHLGWEHHTDRSAPPASDVTIDIICLKGAERSREDLSLCSFTTLCIWRTSETHISQKIWGNISERAILIMFGFGMPYSPRIRPAISEVRLRTFSQQPWLATGKQLRYSTVEDIALAIQETKTGIWCFLGRIRRTYTVVSLLISMYSFGSLYGRVKTHIAHGTKHLFYWLTQKKAKNRHNERTTTISGPQTKIICRDKFFIEKDKIGRAGACMWFV